MTCFERKSKQSRTCSSRTEVSGRKLRQRMDKEERFASLEIIYTGRDSAHRSSHNFRCRLFDSDQDKNRRHGHDCVACLICKVLETFRCPETLAAYHGLCCPSDLSKEERGVRHGVFRVVLKILNYMKTSSLSHRSAKS